jgi:6-phosphogluconolactonase
VSPDSRHVFAALRSPPFSVATFAIDPDHGTLAYAGSGPLAEDMACIATDRTSSFLLGASYVGSCVTVSPIGRDGVVGPMLQRVATLPNAHAVMTDASNRHVLHTSLGGDAVYQQVFDPVTGTLQPNQPAFVSVDAHAGPRHFVFSADARFVFVLCELDGSIHVLPYDAETGRLGPTQQRASTLPQQFSGKPWAADVHVTPDGNYLYASERTSSTLAAFRIDEATGALTPLGSFPTATQPRSFAIDPSGELLVAAGERSSGVTVHAIDATGALRALSHEATGDAPSWIEIVSLAVRP